MRRKPVIAGNWKMNNTIPESIRLVSGLKKLISDIDHLDVVVAPNYVALNAVSVALQDTNIKLAAQNMSDEEKGAYTGEVSASMLKDTHCSYVILGHSERRQYYKESNDFINRKILTALENELIPIFCVGETLEEREGTRAFGVIETQVKEGLRDVEANEIVKLVIAYEPVWAIGTGKVATPEQAEEIHVHIRSILKRLYGSKISESIRILYGGSVTPDNVKEIMIQKNVDGVLVGGASLDAEKFSTIAKYDE